MKQIQLKILLYLLRITEKYPNFVAWYKIPVPDHTSQQLTPYTQYSTFYIFKYLRGITWILESTQYGHMVS